ncbi:MULTISPECIES: PGF-CTERM sorting domain-containing protein [unclassified Methanosarcina]|uniref:PGF-CTERM sorting domain-containing protein n=1 Tax=unclassified Methanosarcina TaxID=2644672 RepID=UPI0012E06B90|nr:MULTISPECIES: PGF-CTERM sorting domain-containing protein [unclassified Methanosarcina]
MLAVVALIGAPMASAKPNYLTSFNQHYDTAGTRLDSCATCHNGEARNPYGRAYAGSGKNFVAIENLDSDGDGFTNLVEINALTFPGNPDDYPQVTSETPSETTVNATESSASATEQPASEVPVNNTTEEQAATEVPVSNATPEQQAPEVPDNATGEQESPGFEAIPVLVGLLAVACLRRRDIRK